jgi:hypothetical protein
MFKLFLTFIRRIKCRKCIVQFLAKKFNEKMIIILLLTYTCENENDNFF